MKTTHFSAFHAFCVSLVLLCSSFAPLRAEQFGLFTYRVVGETTVEITGYPADAVGPVSIPAEISGTPVTSIGYRAFWGCDDLTEITIPASVTMLGVEALGGTGAQAIWVAPGNPAYTSVDGVLFNLTQTLLIQCPRGRSGAYTVPATVTTIGSFAFNYCHNLTSVIVPSSVTTIGERAFAVCYYMTSLAIFPGVTTIGPYAFAVSGLITLTLPSTVISIGDNAFQDCRSLQMISVEGGNPAFTSEGGVLFDATRTTLVACPKARAGAYTIPLSVSTIGNGAFYSCTGLSSVTIPPGVTAIGGQAFAGCTGLSSVTIPPGVTAIGNFAFSNCTGLATVTLQQGLGSIGAGMFSGCTSLTSIPIPSSVTSIGGAAFWDCSGLTSLVIPSGVTSIAADLCFRCTGLTSVTIPSSVTSIGLRAFYECRGLTSIALPTGLTSIGDETFRGCVALTGLTLPPGLTTIPKGAFWSCTSFNSITLPPGITTIGIYAFADCTGLSSLTLPSSVTSIGHNALSGCTGLTGVTLPAGLTIIDHSVFFGCTGLTSITLPPALTTIGQYAFRGCTGLTTITLPASITALGLYSFWDCPALTKVIFLGDYTSGVGIAFGFAQPTFTIYYLSSRTNFTSPTWQGYATVKIDEATWPAASWLLAHGYWYDTNLHQDTDGDGVDLLMAYALNLDPRLNLRGSLPGPVAGPGTLGLSFHATSPGITYTAETSVDLQNWTTNGVTQSAPGSDQRSTATVLRDSPRRFLRLVVED